MILPKKTLFFSSIIFWCISINVLNAEVKLPAFISDGLVLQRNAEVKIWGWASSKEKIIIDFNGNVYKGEASIEGKWEFTLNNLKAGGPYTMVVSGENTIIINNILVGDVWLCSGQSNMELPMRRVSPLYEDEIKSANNPKIHYIKIPQR
ncbi:MAG: sialate O-acetylesterase, partial [Flavobacteriales bacterium]